ncbi:MAG: hypothetical protein ABSF03_31035 [Streptosporangiaceae bacterium]
MAGHRAGLQFGEKAAAESKAANGGRHPHPLDVGGRAGAEPDPAAADRLPVQAGDQEETGRRGHLVVTDQAPGRVETAVEAPADLTEVGLQAKTGIGVTGIPLGDLDRGGGQQPLGFGHRLDQPGALARGERAEDGGGRLVGALVQHGPLGQPGGGQADGADAPVGPARLHDHQASVLQRPQQPAQIARVQVKPRP